MKSRLPRLDQWLEGVPVVIVEYGRPLTDRLQKSRVDVSDVLSAARQLHGLERMEQIKYAVLERSGHISIIPWDPDPMPGRSASVPLCDRPVS